MVSRNENNAIVIGLTKNIKQQNVIGKAAEEKTLHLSFAVRLVYEVMVLSRHCETI
jgi:hypothetical protein